MHLQHFTGTMENWDPKVLDDLARDREVIIFDNKGVAGTGGQTPDTIGAIAKDTAAFIDALGLEKIDLLGFSMGGMVAQQITLDRPELINRLMLLGTAPRGGHNIENFTLEVWAIFAKEFPSEFEIVLETPLTKVMIHFRVLKEDTIFQKVKNSDTPSLPRLRSHQGHTDILS